MTCSTFVRQAALGAGIPNSVVCTIINKVCSSGMKATMVAALSIQVGANDIVVAGGMESMSNVPKYLPNSRKGSRLGHDSLVDGMIKDGLWDVYNEFGMGVCGELCADTYKITRHQQDDYAVRSFSRGIVAQNNGAFKWEVASVRSLFTFICSILMLYLPIPFNFAPAGQSFCRKRKGPYYC